MKITDYKTGDAVQVQVMNPRLEDRVEWREAEVLRTQMIYPSYGSKHKPYPIVIVRVNRTYCKAEPIYRFIGNIPVFVDNSLEFYDKLNDEGIIYENQIRPLPEKDFLNADEKQHPDYQENL